MSAVQEGLDVIHNSITKYVLEFLKTGEFRNKSPNAYMIAYQKVVELSDDEGDSSKRLYEYYINTIKIYIQDALKDTRSLEGEALVDNFLKENTQIKILIYWMRKIFFYLDKFYMKNVDKSSLFQNALKAYHDTMFVPLKEKLFKVSINMLREDRQNKVVEKFKIKKLIKVFEEMDLLNAELMKKGDELIWVGKPELKIADDFVVKYLLPETESFALEKSNNEINGMSVPEYVRSCLKYLDEEDTMKIEYFNSKYHKQLDKINFEKFITTKTKELAKKETGIKFMLNNRKDQEIKEIFQLISKEPTSLKCITDELDPYIREKGEELNQNKDISRDPKLLIPELIKLKISIDNLVLFAFEGTMLFETCKKNAFSAFLNKTLYQKQIANYCDYEMRAGIRGNSDAQIEEKMNNITNIFKCMLSKETFILEYSKRLGDRLLSNKSQSITHEKNLISRMKNEFGISNVSRITRKMEDLEISKAEMDIFRQEPHRAKPNSIEMNVQVLDDSSWEIEKIKFEKLEIFDKKILDCLETFNKFYVKRHQAHRLKWVYGVTNLEIQLLKLNKPYQAVCTLLQYCILLVLEKHGALTIKTISDYLNFDTKYVCHEANFLFSNATFNQKRMCALGVIVPENHTDGKEFTEDVKVSINKGFQNNSLKVSTIPSTGPRKTPEELEKEERDETLNRKKYHNQIIDATIVRIMKGRIGQKTSHGFLVTETSKQIDLFTAQPAQIKERIEHLMGDCFIKRCEDDRNCYEYIA